MAGKHLFSFYLGRYLYGIDILVVREIIQHFDITPVEHAQQKVVGLINLRGQIVTALDASVALGKKKTISFKDMTCIVLKSGFELSKYNYDGIFDNRSSEDVVGLLVDKVNDVYDIKDDSIEPVPPNLSEVDSEMLIGVVKLEKRLMMVLNVSKLLANEKENHL